MLDYSNAAINYAVLRCLEKPNFKVLIATPKGEQALNQIKRMIQDTGLPAIMTNEIIKFFSNRTISFNNGSLITIVPASENIKANKCHLCIVDENLDATVLRSLYYPLETLYMMEKDMKKRNDNNTR